MQAAYLLAFLMMLRIDEVVSLTFESIDKLPNERKWSFVWMVSYTADSMI